jgi:fucose 4-O-acetylase-like acetyltransferase
MILGCITIFTVSIFIDKISIIRSILGYIGRNSLTVFAIHRVFIIGAYLLFPESSVSTIGGLLIVVYALIMSLLVNFLLKKYAPFVFGNFERKK